VHTPEYLSILNNKHFEHLRNADTGRKVVVNRIAKGRDGTITPVMDWTHPDGTVERSGPLTMNRTSDPKDPIQKFGSGRQMHAQLMGEMAKIPGAAKIISGIRRQGAANKLIDQLLGQWEEEAVEQSSASSVHPEADAAGLTLPQVPDYLDPVKTAASKSQQKTAAKEQQMAAAEERVAQETRGLQPQGAVATPQDLGATPQGTQFGPGNRPASIKGFLQENITDPIAGAFASRGPAGPEAAGQVPAPQPALERMGEVARAGRVETPAPVATTQAAPQEAAEAQPEIPLAKPSEPVLTKKMELSETLAKVKEPTTPKETKPVTATARRLQPGKKLTAKQQQALVGLYKMGYPGITLEMVDRVRRTGKLSKRNLQGFNVDKTLLMVDKDTGQVVSAYRPGGAEKLTVEDKMKIEAHEIKKNDARHKQLERVVAADGGDTESQKRSLGEFTNAWNRSVTSKILGQDVINPEHATIAYDAFKMMQNSNRETWAEWGLSLIGDKKIPMNDLDAFVTSQFAGIDPGKVVMARGVLRARITAEEGKPPNNADLNALLVLASTKVHDGSYKTIEEAVSGLMAEQADAAQQVQ
jgi:hypothetical protein